MKQERRRGVCRRATRRTGWVDRRREYSTLPVESVETLAGAVAELVHGLPAIAEAERAQASL
jgi:hypothetical protein